MTHRWARRGRRLRATTAAVVAAVAVALGGCAVDAPGGDAPTGPSEGTIGLLLPEAKSARYETTDRPTFESVVERRCPTCHMLYANAGQDAADQQLQAESMLARGADVLVLDAVDAIAATSIVAEAQRLGVPVVAYDRFVEGADYYVSFDNELIGYLMGESLVGAVLERAAAHPDAGGRRPGVLLVNGAATDPNAAEFAAGVHRALDGEEIDVLAEYETPDWSPDKATDWVEGQLIQYSGRVDGVFAANDGIAGGAIAAMKAAGLDPVPPTTGQDGELAAVQRVVSGDQYMTVYKATAQQARTAAELAVRILRGEDPRATATIGGVPTLLLAPRAVGVDDVQRVIVEGGVYTTEEICTRYYVDACVEAGLLEEVP
ncbi:substrate-binding domain-containing protein [Cellulosimicrobium arenosum]|uniref:Substrate-binding domain-containing protein n=1 Tax=Cellulosimicrobium arenosum TaxID=2708133 RepID=A0A927G863_9MICO|nr:substrate-binding domain-containing protein [Cellulosimicrobium arenosum]MBD8078691.1 substrate-binding domain-containing protein [Cellulosimicrobium arenosum]